MLSAGPDDLICSARGCEQAATQAVLWRNPKIPRKNHKTWLTCDDHADFLENYLGYRNFPRKRVPITEIDTAQLD